MEFEYRSFFPQGREMSLKSQPEAVRDVGTSLGCISCLSGAGLRRLSEFWRETTGTLRPRVVLLDWEKPSDSLCACACVSSHVHICTCVFVKGSSRAPLCQGTFNNTVSRVQTQILPRACLFELAATSQQLSPGMITLI